MAAQIKPRTPTQLLFHVSYPAMVSQEKIDGNFTEECSWQAIPTIDVIKPQPGSLFRILCKESGSPQSTPAVCEESSVAINRQSVCATLPCQMNQMHFPNFSWKNWQTMITQACVFCKHFLKMSKWAGHGATHLQSQHSRGWGKRMATRPRPTQPHSPGKLKC